MWFLFALTTFICWSSSDLFYKKSNGESERFSHLKTSAVVGIIMGIFAIITILIRNLDYNPLNLVIYMPVSLMYILSMTIGYFGLRYLELSITSPIQNASGAVTFILLIFFTHELPGPLAIFSVVLISAGVIYLGYLENKQEVGNKKRLSGFAIIIPVIYCIIDALGTFFDGMYLDDVESSPLIGVTEDNIEDIANVSYQLTFFIVAVAIIIFLLIKKEKLISRTTTPRVVAGTFETLGQLAYVYALSGNAVIAAPIISSYCVGSVILSRIFLKEKLGLKKSIAVGLVIIGIVIIGIIEE